jgi:hypothetical protein
VSSHEGTKITKGLNFVNLSSHEGTKGAKELLDAEQASGVVVDTAFHIHKELGPGLLESVYINFGFATFKEGVKRLVNGPQPFVSSRLRANQSPQQF